MDTANDMDQFQLLEEKVEGLITTVGSLRVEKEALAEKTHLQEDRLADLTRQIGELKSSRDQAKQRIISLLEKIEQLGL